MAKQKSRSKKSYRPKQFVLLGQKNSCPWLLARYASSDEALRQIDKDKAVEPLSDLICRLKNGSTENKHFYWACEAHYRYVSLLSVMKQIPVKGLSADEEMLFKLDAGIKMDEAVNQSVDMFTALSEREQQIGRWVAKAEELNMLEEEIKSFEYYLSLASWKHWVAALKESEAVLQQEYRRIQHKKRKAA